MTAQKRSVWLDEAIAKAVARAAKEDGASVGVWLSQAAAIRLRLRDGLRGVAAWGAETGKLSRDEIAAGEALFEHLLSANVAPARVRCCAPRCDRA
jgi:hypothetical protein